MKFQELGLIDPILKALREQGYETPTPIQRGAIPPALAGRDVLGCAQTGTGKTCAFAAPILQRLSAASGKPRVIRGLVLTPTRELALQIQECFEDYGKYLPLRSAVIFGGVGQNPQVEKLRRGVDILVATPGRLLDLHGQKLLDLSHVELFVLDEADRMLDMGFIHDVRRVLRVLPEKKQTLFFSATMPPEVMELVNALLHDYARVEVDPVSSPVEVIRQSLYYVDKANKTRLLAHLIQEKEMDSVLVFSRTKYGANRIASDLTKHGIPAAAIHGNKSQTARQKALADFKCGQIRALVATDIAARGIDIDELKWVVNYDLPEVPETYVHRIGRTGRAGHDGSALSFCRADERDYLKQIEKLLRRSLPVVEDHPFPMAEPPSGVDPMTQARREARENARAKRDARTQRTPAPQKPPMEKAPAGQRSEPPRQNAAGQRSEPIRQDTVVRHTPSAPAPEQNRTQRSRRGVRQGNLSATVPSAPAMPSADFVKPDPLGSDVVMDATARLLAPRKPAHTPHPAASVPASEMNGGDGTKRPQKRKKPRKNGEPSAKPVQQQVHPQNRVQNHLHNQGAQNHPHHPGAQERPHSHPPVEKKAETESPLLPGQEHKTDSPKQKKTSGGTPAPKSGNRTYSRRDRPRPLERSLYSIHHKDSTEQKESMMKPYYLSDDR